MARDRSVRGLVLLPPAGDPASGAGCGRPRVDDLRDLDPCASGGGGQHHRGQRGVLVVVREGAEAARQLDHWLDERVHDLRVAASADEVAENLAGIQGSGGGQAIGRVRDHLNSLRGRLPDHEALLVDDARGRVVTSSGGRLSGVQPPPDKLNGLRTAELFLGDPYWDAGLAKAALVLAVPIRQAADGRFLGVLAAKVNLRSVTDILQRLAPGEGGLGEGGGGDVFLMTDQGRLIMRSRVSSADLMRAKLPAPTTQALFDREGTAVVYKRADGREVGGTLRRVPLLRWAAVAA